ncbi:hypothetical protein ANO11243_028730 [Dothideomycetidae sp. 11243]|nr:hypothetical protein ANO11243_028730 [fungal sp. No.11243]
MAADTGAGSASPQQAHDKDHTLDDTTMIDIHGDGDESDSRSPGNSHHGSDNDIPAKKDPKDPSRPRRKKARRACFACQRAHLTCGDERPCLRCIKRGLQDQCHDGVRKKAKYLHDAPPEALVPGLGGSYNSQQTTGTAQMSNSGGGQSTDNISPMVPTGNNYFPNRTASSEFTNLPQRGSIDQGQSPRAMNASLDAFGSTNRDDFNPDNQDLNSMQVNMASNDQRPGSQSYTMPFDPTDPHFFNFDISGLNFDNHYGALEFGMLGHMSSKAFESPDDTSLLNSLNYDATNTYSPITPNFQYGMGNNAFQNWQSNQQSTPRQNSSGQAYAMSHAHDNHPAAFAIGEGNGSISSASPGNNGIDMTGYNSSPVSTVQNTFSNRRSQQESSVSSAPYSGAAPVNPFASTTSTHPVRRRRDPSTIYRSVKEPYSYTTGFHLLTAFVVKRFSKDKTLRIAKALASIRPSFISCTRDLSRDDLIFMEKGFQRNLLLYDDYINAYGSPTIICRRTGEVAAVSKEFSLLTGWRRDVLLGKEPNLNVNHGSNESADVTGVATGSSSRGAATPSKFNSSVEIEPGRPQPVFLAELLDDDTAVQFYEDFAKMAFGDSRGQVQRRGKLLKYKTKDDPGWGRIMDDSTMPDGSNVTRAIATNIAQDGKVDVMFCHIVKRDTFDMPMMIIINFLPIIL